MKNIYTIEPGAPFLGTLARELWRQAEGDGFRLSRMQILLPTRRACRHLGAAFAHIADGKPVLLPRMRPLGEADEEEMALADPKNIDLPPAMAPLKRLMLLTQQVRRRDPSLSWDQAAQGAEALARFLDQIQIEQCDTGKLPELVEEQELAEHWRQTILFLDIVTKNWQLILAEQTCLDPAQRRNAVLAAQADLWRKHPPAFPVIAAGSTGSIPATAALLDVIAQAPNGAVILPGLDLAADNETWDAIDDTHPQHGMKNLLMKMGVERNAVRHFGAQATASTRAQLLGEAMRPAGLTEAWRGLRGKLDQSAVAGLTRLDLDHPQEEAQVIALRLRAFLEKPNGTAAFVTANRALAARVAALLRRWGVEADDSGGSPLAMLPVGAFLNLVLAAAAPQAGAVDLLALLKHPFAACGLPPAACRAQAREAEIRARNLENEDFAAVRKILRPLTRNWHRPTPLAQHIAAHIAAAEAIAASDAETGAARLWRDESGEDAAMWLDEWRAGAEALPPLPCSDYAALFGSLAGSKILRSARATHPRLGILGPLEARLIDADLVILGGMNEGAWPPDAGFDPWMSRAMRKKFGLPSPEFRIGLSAHDFVQLACAKEVMLTRAQRSGGNPTVPSRFLLQIDAVLRAAGLSDDRTDALTPPEPWRDWAQNLDAPQDIAPCARPQPRPPATARPTTLAVTEITTWLRNPYAIYAKHVLKLRKLEELDAELDAADRGTMIHEALEKFVKTYPDILPPDAEAKLLDAGREVFAREAGDPRVRAFWWARFADIAGWFIIRERERRANGIFPIGIEAKGRLKLGAFTLTGKADRIDRLPDGALSIVDYKTGAAPSKKEIDSGLEPQLQLLALIAAAGGFADIGARPAGALEYWILKDAAGETRSPKTPPAELAEAARAGLERLIAAFADPATPYEVVPRARLHPRFDDYIHLSRRAEWGRAEEET